MSALVSGDFSLKNPVILEENHPPSLEGLSKNSVILAVKTDRILEYGVIPFTILSVDGKHVSEDSISLLKKIIEDDYSVYIFKNPTTIHEKTIFHDLIDNHDFVLKDYSESFCTVKIKTKENLLVQNDLICLQ